MNINQSKRCFQRKTGYAVQQNRNLTEFTRKIIVLAVRLCKMCRTSTFEIKPSYFGVVTLKRVTSGGVLRGVASRQHSFDKMSHSGDEPLATPRLI